MTGPMGPEGFYVTVRDGGRTGYLLGPYSTKTDAETDVPAGKRIAERVNSRAVWYAYGVTRVVLPPGAVLPPGRLNRIACAGGDPAAAAVTAHRHAIADYRHAAGADTGTPHEI